MGKWTKENQILFYWKVIKNIEKESRVTFVTPDNFLKSLRNFKIIENKNVLRIEYPYEKDVYSYSIEFADNSKIMVRKSMEKTGIVEKAETNVRN